MRTCVCIYGEKTTTKKQYTHSSRRKSKKERMATNKLLLFLPLSFDYYSFRNGYSTSVFRLAVVVVVVVVDAAAVVAIVVVAIVQHFK